MKRWTLPIRRADEAVFKAIENGSKKIETRAFSDKYTLMQKGDIIAFSWAGKKLEKKIIKRRWFPSVEAMYKKISFRHVFPYLDSLEEAISTHRSFPNYEERLKRGIFAWDIE